MRLVIISGLSGSGKSVALHVLEDLGYYCIDNIPVALLRQFFDEILPRQDAAFENIGLGLDARNPAADIANIPQIVRKLRDDGLACEIIFLQASDNVLLSRFSDTRRRHPLANAHTSLEEAIAKERELLGPVIDTAELVIDTTRMSVHQLRDQIRERIGAHVPGTLSIMVESFGYKHGLPANADFVFDVRCLPNPFWDPALRPLTGKDEPVRTFLDSQPLVQQMVDDVVDFLDRWIQRYQDFQRAYLTIAVGCTGGQHRSVYVAEAVARRLAHTHGPIRTQHRELT